MALFFNTAARPGVRGAVKRFDSSSRRNLKGSRSRGMLQIFLFPKKHGVGLGEPAFRFTDFSFECGVVDRALIDIE
jgi:hypothetical protein